MEVVHDFFPLTGGHNIADCFACHTPGGDFTGLSSECDACHHNNNLATTDPNHFKITFHWIVHSVIQLWAGVQLHLIIISHNFH